MKRLLLVALAFLLLLSGCSADDPLTETVYTSDVFPSNNTTFALGSSDLTWNAGYFASIFIDGVENPWESMEVLPDQTGHAGDFLTTNGTVASWDTLVGGGDMTTAVYDPDADSDIAEAQLQLNYATHSNANDPTADQKAALAGTSGAPSVTNKYVTDTDPRNTDARTPTAHNQDANTITTGTLDGDRLPAMSETKKGGVPATGVPSGLFLKDDGTWAAGGGYTDENVDDRVSALIQNGTGIAWTYDDVGNTLTGNVSITQYTDELAQDTIAGGLIQQGTGITWIYDDLGNTLTPTITNDHTHANKATLDAIQEAFTTALKTSYDWLVTNITSAWKTTVDNFISSKGQASGLAPLDANSKVPTVNLGGAGADGTKYLRGDQTWATPPGGGTPPAWKGNIVGAFGSGDPESLLSMMQNAGVVSPTPTGITISIARIAYFKLDTAITVNQIRWYGVGATSAVYHIAIYRNSDSARLTADLNPNTTANAWNSVSAGGITLAADTLYFIAVSVDTTGTTPGILAMGATAAATTGILPLPTGWTGNLDIDMASPKVAPAGFAQFAVTTGALPTTAPARANRNSWVGGMPAIFLDNSNL